MASLGAWWNDVSTLDFILSGRQPLPILISATAPPPTKPPHILGHSSMAYALWSLHMLLSVLGNAPCPGCPLNDKPLPVSETWHTPPL